MTQTVPLWVEVVTGVLVLLGAFMALVGSLGLARLESFFQRMHAPTLGATVGTWSVTLAIALYFSIVRDQFFAHALLIGLMLAVTTPVTTIFLMRAAIFRVRISGDPTAPPPLSGPSPTEPRG